MCHHHLSRRIFVLSVPALAIGLAACGQGSTSGPGEIKWGRDVCDYCGMVIDDAHFAAQLRGGPKDKTFKFDDLGDAILFWAKQDWAEDPATRFWVGGLETGQWQDGRKAFYIGGQRSPMGHGYGALDQPREGALDFSALKVAVLSKGSPSRCEPSALGGKS